MTDDNTPANPRPALADPDLANAPCQPRLEHAAHAVRALGDGIAAVEMNGALVCVVLSPMAWQKIQATNAAWQKLFHWALRHIETATLRRMAHSVDQVFADRRSRRA